LHDPARTPLLALEFAKSRSDPYFQKREATVPLQNRVTPFGEIVAIPQRGTLMGNRGIIHDPGSRTLLARRWTTKSWIVCVCDFKGRRRSVMGGRSWTELFFLDEATALAAGHRPCFECRRRDAVAFRAAWAAGNGVAAPRAAEIDDTLHRERLAGREKRLHEIPAPIDELPDGIMLASGGESYIVLGGEAFRWSPAGYGESASALPDARLLTPPSTVRARAAGYRPAVAGLGDVA
jgi:hypothetical protein